jgi:hypothetical protein
VPPPCAAGSIRDRTAARVIAIDGVVIDVVAVVAIVASA